MPLLSKSRLTQLLLPIKPVKTILSQSCSPARVISEHQASPSKDAISSPLWPKTTHLLYQKASHPVEIISILSGKVCWVRPDPSLISVLNLQWITSNLSSHFNGWNLNVPSKMVRPWVLAKDYTANKIDLRSRRRRESRLTSWDLTRLLPVSCRSGLKGSSRTSTIRASLRGTNMSIKPATNLISYSRSVWSPKTPPSQLNLSK